MRVAGVSMMNIRGSPLGVGMHMLPDGYFSPPLEEGSYNGGSRGLPRTLFFFDGCPRGGPNDRVNFLSASQRVETD